LRYGVFTTPQPFIGDKHELLYRLRQSDQHHRGLRRSPLGDLVNTETPVTPTRFKSVRVGVVPSTLHRYLRALDANGSGFGLTAENIYPDDRLEFALYSEAGTHEDSFNVTLHPDGTWSATTDVILGPIE
jgi:hypothetical protein